MSERDHVAHGEGAEDDLSLDSFEQWGGQPTGGGPPAPSDLDLRDEVALDTPLHVRSLQQLSISERARYRKAQTLLASGGDVRALMRDGNLPLAGLGVYEALLMRSWAVRFQDKREMVR